jgi:hypothetical protein
MHMDRKFVWIAIFVVLALTAVTVVNCRRLPDPWEPTVQASSPDRADHT